MACATRPEPHTTVEHMICNARGRLMGALASSSHQPLRPFENHNTEMTAGWPAEPLTQPALGLNALNASKGQSVWIECAAEALAGQQAVPGQDSVLFLQDSAPHLDLCRSTSVGSDADLAGRLWLAFVLLRGASERDFLRLGFVDWLLDSESERKSSTTGGRKQRSMAAGMCGGVRCFEVASVHAKFCDKSISRSS